MEVREYAERINDKLASIQAIHGEGVRDDVRMIVDISFIAEVAFLAGVHQGKGDDKEFTLELLRKMGAEVNLALNYFVHRCFDEKLQAELEPFIKQLVQDVSILKLG